MTEQNQTALVRTRDVTVSYNGNEALHGTSLNFEAGQVTALIGPSGCVFGVEIVFTS